MQPTFMTSRTIPLRITGALDINSSKQIHRTLLQRLEAGTDLEVDLSEITGCDAAGLQLLFSARKSALLRGTSFTVGAMSPAVARTFAEAGMDPTQLRGLPNASI